MVNNLFPENSLGNIPHVAVLLDTVRTRIDDEFADPSKRVHGRLYTDRGRMYKWDAKEKELIRVQTLEEKKFAEEFFSSQVPISGKIFNDPYTCRFRAFDGDGRYKCSFNGQCGHKDRQTAISHGMYGREWFCYTGG